MRPRVPRGFTLVEVLVALAITALVTLLAHQLFATVVDSGHRAVVTRRALDREANARRLLGAAFLSLDVGSDSTGGFVGRPDRASFTAWLPTPEGWSELRKVTVGFEASAWVARWDGERVLLADSVEAVGLDYLLEPGVQAAWVQEWISAVSAPLAVRARVRRAGGRTDTTLYLIKARG